MKIHLVASDEEQFYSQKTQMNIALKYSVVEDFISVIIFKSILKVKKERKFELQYYISFSFQGVFIEKSSKLYAKVTLLENNKELASTKVWCSNNKKIYDFSKELQFKLHRKHPENCKIIVQLKKYTGFGFKSILVV